MVALVVGSSARQTVADTEEHLRAVLPGYMRPTLMAWVRTGPDATTAQTDERELVRRLGAAAQQSNSNYFAVSADGAVEPMDEV